jgi:hypothetical protein
LDFPRDASATGRLKPGEGLQETAVTEQLLSVSRSSVREAFRQLDARSDRGLFHLRFQALDEVPESVMLSTQQSCRRCAR